MDLKKALSAIVPTLARTIGGPLGAIATNVIAAALGVEANKPDELEQKVASLTGEDLVKLRAAEKQFVLDMKRADIDVLKIDAEDRANARDLQKATRSRTAPVLAFTTVGLMIAMVAAVCWRAIPEVNRSAFDILLGGVIGSYTTVLTFYFGSSRGSQAKDELLSQGGDRR